MLGEPVWYWLLFAAVVLLWALVTYREVQRARRWAAIEDELKQLRRFRIERLMQERRYTR